MAWGKEQAVRRVRDLKYNISYTRFEFHLMESNGYMLNGQIVRKVGLI